MTTAPDEPTPPTTQPDYEATPGEDPGTLDPADSPETDDPETFPL